jgi:hypothetical protein
MDQMTLVRPRRKILGGIALGVAVAATAMGVYNRVQIQQLKEELFEVKENTGRPGLQPEHGRPLNRL